MVRHHLYDAICVNHMIYTFFYERVNIVLNAQTKENNFRKVFKEEGSRTE
jgi:hypothetical protein